MPVTELKILYIDKDTEVAKNLISQLKSSEKGYLIELSPSIDQALERLKKGNVDLVLLVMDEPPEEVFKSFSRLHHSFPDLSVIILTTSKNMNLALKLVQAGAHDHLFKEQNENFLQALQVAIERSRLIQRCYHLANFAEWNTHPIIELNHKGEISYLNLSARGQFPDLVEKGLQHPLLQELQKLIFDLLPKLHSEVTVFNREVTLQDKHYEQQLFALPNSGIYVYIIDITERQQLRAQALLSDRLATVGTLAAGVAHEINNPIAWVLENLRYLKENLVILKVYHNTINQIAQESDAQKKLQSLDKLVTDIHATQQQTIYKFDEIIDETLHGAERIRDIVRDLKGFARVEKAEIGPVDVNAVLNTAISMAVPEFKYRARLEKKLTPNLPPLLVNSGKLHQVFLNLIVNAAQAIPEGNIQDNKITVTTQLSGDKIQIDISDTGLGIPGEILPRIFDPFFTTKQAGSGTGLGLAIVHEVISKFGGEITVSSGINKGTTFTVLLPAHFELDFKSMPAEKPAVSKSGKKQILVIDDEISLIKTMQRMLENHHSVMTVLGGEAALSLLTKSCKNFDVIICDLNMPNINGADLYRYVANNYPGHEHKFVFITAGVYSQSMNAFLADIENSIVEKPFTPKDLLETIDKVILATEKSI